VASKAVLFAVGFILQMIKGMAGAFAKAELQEQRQIQHR
jgi:hypothetical protein